MLLPEFVKSVLSSPRCGNSSVTQENKAQVLFLLFFQECFIISICVSLLSGFHEG